MDDAEIALSENETAETWAERDRLDEAVADALGRVVGRVEMYDEALSSGMTPVNDHLWQLVERCRELKLAHDARTKALGLLR